MADFFHTIGGKIVAAISGILLLFSGAAHTATNPQPSVQTAAAVVATQEVGQTSSATTSTPSANSEQATIVNNYITQPVIERTVQTAVMPSGSGYVSESELAAKLSALSDTFGKTIYGTTYPAPATNYGSGGLLNIISLSNKIDQLTGTKLFNITVSGVSGLTASDIPALSYLSSTGGTVSGLSSFSNASTSLFSVFNNAYFGGTATSSFDSTGALTLATPLAITSGGMGTTTWLTNSIPYFNGTYFTSNNANLNFNGTTLTTGNFTSSGNVSLGNATSTNFFATTASSTNLFAQTASLGVVTANTIALTTALPVSSGGTGQTSFGQGWLSSNGTTLSASTSPTVNYITATSTTATSTFAGNVAGRNAHGWALIDGDAQTGPTITPDKSYLNSGFGIGTAANGDAGAPNTFSNGYKTASFGLDYQIFYSYGVELVNWSTANGYRSGSGVVAGWTANTNPGVNAADVGLSRLAPGSLALGTGAANSTAGSLSLTNLTASGALTVGAGPALVTSPSAAVFQHGAADVSTGAVAQTITFQGNTNASAAANGPLATITGALGGSGTGSNKSVGGELRLQGGLAGNAAGTGGAITFYTAPLASGSSASLAATIEANGNLTLTPGGYTSFGVTLANTTAYSYGTATFDVSNTGFRLASAGLFGWASGAANGSALDTILTRAGAATVQLGAADVASGAVAQTLQVQSNTGESTTGPDFSIIGSGGTTAGGNIFIKTKATTVPATAVTITSSGNVGIGTTSPYALLSISNSKNIAANTPLFVIASTTGGTATTTILSVAATGDVTIIGSATTCVIGNGTSPTGCSASDQRLKDNITALDASSSLSAVRQLNPVSFVWNSFMTGNGAPTSTQFGFIAQDVSKIFPNLIAQDVHTGYFKLDYQGFFAPVVAAIQVLAQKVDNIATTVAEFAHEFVTDRLVTKELCVQKSDGTNVCVTGDQLATVISGAGQASAGGGASGVASGSASADTEPPVITINGSNPADMNVGDTYSDLGASVTDNVDQNLGIKTFVGSTPIEFAAIDTSLPATYHINYVATDNAGNTATSTRTVIVKTADSAALSTESASESSTSQTTDTSASTTDAQTQ